MNGPWVCVLKGFLQSSNISLACIVQMQAGADEGRCYLLLSASFSCGYDAQYKAALGSKRNFESS